MSEKLPGSGSMRLWLLLLAMLSLAEAALPPGFEDELYCLEHCCLKERNTRLEGRESMRWQCVPRLASSTEACGHVRPWGSAAGEGLRLKYIAAGMTQDVCLPLPQPTRVNALFIARSFML